MRGGIMKRGKSGIAIVVILVTAVLLTFTLAACGETSHKHSLTHVDAEESTCTLQGNIEYWECTSCGKYFKDADATIEATWEELRLPMLEHDYDPATHRCKNCGSYDDEGAQTALSYELNEQKDGYIVSSCGSSATSVEIPDEINGLPVVGIKGGAFENRSNLTSVTIGNNVTSIDSHAFYGCSGLTSITIPDSVTSIDSHAFYGCSGLTSITIPDSVTSIGWSAFDGCSGLTSVTIPDSVTSIDSYAFSGCSGLTSITIPDSVTSIGSSAFSGCSGLTSIVVPNSVTSIGDWAFDGCSGLTSITIPFVGEKADGSGSTSFDGIFGWTVPDSLKEVIITGGTSIGDWAFDGCSGLISVTIPDSVTSIGNGAFHGCSGLTSITIPFVGESADGLGDTHFGYIFGAYDASDNEYCVPASLQEVVVTGGDVIAEDAFYGCGNLTSVTLPDGITSIGDSAFYGCDGLLSLTIPDSVTSIGNGAFWRCSGLTTINFQGTMAQWQAIEKGSNWDYLTGEYAVICTDGTISKADA